MLIIIKLQTYQNEIPAQNVQPKLTNGNGNEVVTNGYHRNDHEFNGKQRKLNSDEVNS